jgi:hypothetical protein
VMAAAISLRTIGTLRRIAKSGRAAGQDQQ